MSPLYISVLIITVNTVSGYGNGGGSYVLQSLSNVVRQSASIAPGNRDGLVQIYYLGN
jgi:hypothetical protein